ncbi:MAG: glutathione S-transferase family protein [Caulobacteraceae bacterium]
MSLTIYGDSISGNCLKVKWVAERLAIAHRWVEVDIMKGQSRTAEFLEKNPFGQVPVVVLADGRPLAQSNAIITHLAENSDLIPEDAYDRAKMFEWLFWEQYSHEPYVAVVRFQVRYQGKNPADIDSKLVERAHIALQRLEDALADGGFLVGQRLTLADVSLVAYTRLADEGGLGLSRYPAVQAWIARVEQALPIKE